MVSASGKTDEAMLQRWIDKYLEKYAPCLEDYLGHYKNLSTENAIRQAVMGKDEKIHPHQYHFERKGLEKVSGKLLERARDVDGYRTKSFDELYEFVNDKRIKGFGPLAIYDTSLRLAFHFGCRRLPNDVYLHAGAKQGFKKIFNVPTIGDKVKWDKLHPLLKQLKQAYHVENFLCIFKDGEPKNCEPCGSCSQ